MHVVVVTRWQKQGLDHEYIFVFTASRLLLDITTLPSLGKLSVYHERTTMRMRMIILQSLCLRQQAFFEVYHELLCGIPLMHNDEDGMIILQSLCLQHQNSFVVYHDLLLGNTNARWTEGNHYVARIHTRFLILRRCRIV